MKKVKDIDKGWKRIMNDTQELKRSFTKVGVQQGTPAPGTSFDMVSIAAAHEFGSSRTPARPFMAQAFAKNKEQLYTIAKDEWNKVLLGQSSASRSLGLLGTWYQAKIQQTIRNGSFVPNAPETITRKGSSKPLIDTGQLINSIRYIVEVK